MGTGPRRAFFRFSELVQKEHLSGDGASLCKLTVGKFIRPKFSNGKDMVLCNGKVMVPKSSGKDMLPRKSQPDFGWLFAFHVPSYRDIGNGKCYLNSGTWIDHNLNYPNADRTFAVITTGEQDTSAVYSFVEEGAVVNITISVSGRV